MNIDPFILLIIAIVLVLVIFILSLVQSIRRQPTISLITVILLSLCLLFITVLVFYGDKITPADWPQILLMIGLVTITAVYARSTEKMAEETREQRYDTVRPVIDIYRDLANEDNEDKMREALEGTSGDASKGLSCVLKNIGLGPAIDVYSSIQNPFSGERQRHEFGTLAIGEITSRLNISLIHEDNPLALVAYYRDVYGRAFISIREVSSDKKKGWVIGPLQTRPVT